MIDQFPPRGAAVAGRPEAPPNQAWGHPWQLGPNWDWKAGAVLLGKCDKRLIGRRDDRHIVTIAGSRAGKTTTMLIPNLLRYPGSVVVLDPKGELALATAAHRHKMGQQVHILDPFNATGIKSSSFNPFEGLGTGDKVLIPADAAQIVEAMIINNARDSHWTDSGKNLMRGIVLHLLSQQSSPPTLRLLRRVLSGTMADNEKLFTAMANSSAFDGIVANTGAAFLGKHEGSPRELQGILSTVQEQTAPFDDVAHITDRSDFKLSDFRHGKTTIYLVLPAMRMGTHYRWLRLMIQLVFGAMERAPVPRDHLPVWAVLEEFPTLGYMRSVESAAGLMAGFGLKLWAVLQDLTQLKTHYAKSWETFLGNAGIVQAFGNSDSTTCEYLSQRLGMCQVVERQEVRVTGGAMAHGDLGQRENLRGVRLLDPNEVTQWFARESGRQLILNAGSPPIYMQRLAIGDVKR